MSGRGLIALLLVGVAGCLTSPTTVCGELLCPPDTACDRAHGGCVLPQQLAICDGKPDQMVCVYPGETGGRCFDGVCLVPGCGNRVIEAGEACDDGDRIDGNGCSSDCQSDETCGNGIADVAKGESCDDSNQNDRDGCRNDCTLPRCGDGIVDSLFLEQCDEGAANSLAADASCRPNCLPRRCGDGVVDPVDGESCDDGNRDPGDGCAPDCRSTELCGNGVVDGPLGERCDDGGLLSGDGCSSTCAVETAAWVGQPPVLYPRVGAWAATDPVRGALVVTGGDDDLGTPDGDVWELGRRGWRRFAPLDRPPVSSAMAYHVAVGHVVAVAPDPNDDSRSVLWAWTGATWNQLPGAGPTPPPTGGAMAYDTIRDQLVWFGGLRTGAAVAETWIHDGTSWSQRAPAMSPPARSDASLLFDPVRGVIVLHGGDDGGNPLGDTWLWDGASWAERVTTPSPPAAVGRRMAFDRARGVAVLFGGDTASTDVWLFDGTDWTNSGASSAQARKDHVLAPAPDGDGVILFGGQTVPSGSVPGTFRWTGSSWKTLIPYGPAVRSLAASAWHASRGEWVVFGGQQQVGEYNDTWVRGADGWRDVTPSGSPSARWSSAMTYDGARDEVVLFSGIASGTLPADTWVWDGARWQQRFPSNSPDGREDARMAYDAARQRVVLFSGDIIEADTWLWDGTNWTEAAPATTPPPRYAHDMVYDPRRQRVVMFGGTNAQNILADTWEWDGADWTEVTPSVGPIGRAYHRLTYDPVRGVVVLTGGSPDNFNRVLADTWIYDGSDWQLDDVRVDMPRRMGHVAAFDAVAGELIVYGGQVSIFGHIDDMSVLRRGDGTLAETCVAGADDDGDGLAACADPDCWSVCQPLCPPMTSCGSGPRCGDTVCDPVEDCARCAADCGACADSCGDLVCSGAETATSCPGDCG